MLSLLNTLIIFIAIILINELFDIKELHYLFLGIGSSFLLYNISLMNDNRIFSLVFLYLSIILLFLGIFMLIYEYVKKLGYKRQNEQ